jgi:hypothetical protein
VKKQVRKNLAGAKLEAARESAPVGRIQSATDELDKAWAKAAPPQPQIYHEENEKQQHRIVLVTEHGADHSAWFEQHEVAHYKGYLAASHWNQPLLRGVFKQQMVPYQTLGARRFSSSEMVATPRDTERSD